MRFRVTMRRNSRHDSVYPWVTEVHEVAEGCGNDFETLVGAPKYVFTFTRWGARIAAKRKCRQIKKDRSPKRKGEVVLKRWTVDV